MEIIREGVVSLEISILLGTTKNRGRDGRGVRGRSTPGSRGSGGELRGRDPTVNLSSNKLQKKSSRRGYERGAEETVPIDNEVLREIA